MALSIRRTSALVCLSSSLMFAFACGSDDSGSPGDSGDGPNGASGSGSGAASGSGSSTGSGSGASSGSGEPGGEGGFCDGSGPIVPLVRGGTVVRETCTGTIAEQTFTSALCSCEDTNIAGYLRTRSFLSSQGADAPERRGGSVGVNRNYITAGYADVGGSFTVAGPRDILFGGVLKAGGDLRFAPPFDVAGYVEVGRDVYLGSNARAIARVEIGRDLHAPGGVGFRGIALVDVGGDTIVEPVEVPPPCACGEDEVLDVAAIVEDGRMNNDNAAIGLDPQALNVVAGLGVEITLPCGRYYVDQIGGLGSITLRIQGRTALFIGDDLWAGGLFRIELDPGAELDVFVRDNFVIAGAALFGDPARPAATRIYVGGTGDIALAGFNAFSGNVYAPRANIAIGGLGLVHGSLFGKNINAPGAVMVRYDESILDAGKEECAAPPPKPGTCNQCGDCGGGTACVDGSCGACRSDADCCAPLVCNDGVCGQISAPIE